VVQNSALASPSPEPSARVVARKREILEAASGLFRHRGLHATGMRDMDIAAALDMAVGNLYYYFKDKQELLAFCQEDALTGLLELAERVRRCPSGADLRLYLLARGHLLRLHRGTPGSLAHLEVEALEGPWKAVVMEKRDRYEAEYKETIGAGVGDGIFRPADPGLAARALLGALNWTVRWYDPSGQRTPVELADELATFLVRGLLAEGRSFDPSSVEGVDLVSGAS
jgi:AcrR family transcriptional regulator